MSKLKNFLVDVPVKVQVWTRIECQRKQFEIIKKARPSILFLISDNGRNEREKELIRQSRAIVENIDWECTIYKLYEEENQGMYTISRKMHALIWSKVDRCIFLEDDIMPSVSFFRYCAELLERYKDDLRVNVVCGMNHLGICENVNSDYFFSRQGSIWGYATWRRTYEQYYDYSYGQDEYIMKLLMQRTEHNKTIRKRLLAYSQQKFYEGHVAGSEFFLEFAMYGQNQLQIIPQKNMVSNIGCSNSAAHSDEIYKLPKGLRRVFNMEVHEIEFPMKHAKYVIPDVFYEKKRNKIMAYNAPVRALWRKFEMFFLKIRYGDVKGLQATIERKINKLRGTEKRER